MASVIFTIPRTRDRWPAFGADLQPWGANGVYPVRKERAPRHPEHTPDPKRKTPRHGVSVPTISAKRYVAGNPRAVADHLAMIDAMIDIADAISNGNGEPVPQSVDAACKECSLTLTPTTRANVIAYLLEP